MEHIVNLRPKKFSQTTQMLQGNSVVLWLYGAK